VRPDLAPRFVEVDKERHFQLATAEETGGDPVVLTQRDIRELKQDLLAFEDTQGLKAWLKRLRHQSRRGAYYDFAF
jgi:hypothetical protein